jgi:hypothetical protein
MNGFLYIVFFTLVGFLINPSEAYACGSKSISSQKNCCSKEEKYSSHDSNCSVIEAQKSCDGSCNSSNCNSSPDYISIITELAYSIPQKTEMILSKETNFFYVEKRISLNCFAVWSPPKIG